jgi:hypothetical protein
MFACFMHFCKSFSIRFNAGSLASNALALFLHFYPLAFAPASRTAGMRSVAGDEEWAAGQLISTSYLGEVGSRVNT